MNQDQPTIAGERTQTGDGKTHSEDHDQTQSDPQFPGSERGGLLFNGKTAKEWFTLHEVMRWDYGRVIAELEAQDREIKKHEALDGDRLSKLHPHGVQQ